MACPQHHIYYVQLQLPRAAGCRAPAAPMMPVSNPIMAAIPRYRSHRGPALLSAGFRPSRGCPVGGGDPAVARRLRRGARAAERASRDRLARARNGLRLCRRDRRRLSADRDPELDGPHAIARRIPGRTRGPVGGRAARGPVLRPVRRAGRGSRRSVLSGRLSASSPARSLPAETGATCRCLRHCRCC